jgi:hypothetical protein
MKGKSIPHAPKNVGHPFPLIVLEMDRGSMHSTYSVDVLQ